jgi:hypothetical protein
MKRRTYKRGQIYRTTYNGPIKSQIFKLVSPLGRLGGEHGGHWYVRYLQHNYEGTLLVDHCPRVSPSYLKRINL